MFADKLFWLGLASVALNFAGYAPYIWSVIRGGVKPQRITWGLWAVLITIAFVNQVQNGGGYSTWFIGSTLVLIMTVFVLSWKLGVGGASKLDITCLVAALLLFAAWIITRDTHATTIIVVLIDALGAVPTIFKAYARPETEAYLQWCTSALAGLCSIIAVIGQDCILLVYPAYVITANSLIVLAKYFGTRKLELQGRFQN